MRRKDLGREHSWVKLHRCRNQKRLDNTQNHVDNMATLDACLPIEAGLKEVNVKR